MADIITSSSNTSPISATISSDNLKSLTATLSNAANLTTLLTAKMYINDYTVSINAIPNGYKLIVTKGNNTQIATLLSLSEEEVETIKGDEEQRIAAESVRAANEIVREANEVARQEAEENRETQIKLVSNMTVDAETVDEDEEAEIIKTIVDGHYNLYFKIPRGKTGPKGDTGSDTDERAVHYDADSGITDEEKKQARDNISAGSISLEDSVYYVSSNLNLDESSNYTIASDINAGLIKTSEDKSTYMDGELLAAKELTYSEFCNKNNDIFVSKGTINNLIKHYKVCEAKNAMDDIAEPNTKYFLGIQNSVSINLPNDSNAGDFVQVVFYSNSNPSSLIISGNIIGCDINPEANKRFDIKFTYDGIYWATEYSFINLDV